MGHSGDFARWPHLGPIRPMDGGGHLGPLSSVYGYRGATDLLTHGPHSESSETGGSSCGSRRTACLRTPPETSAGRPVCDFPDAAADEDLVYVHRNGHRREKMQPEDLMAARGAISTEHLMRGPPCGRCVGLGLRGGPRARTAGSRCFINCQSQQKNQTLCIPVKGHVSSLDAETASRA